ncbi:MAG: Abi family protein [Ruminococcus sp.]|nr:Abi family protein [Ruminococcus sp.]
MEILLYHSPMLEKKPYCSATELVDKMESKGITFQIIQKNDAAKYLIEKNNFLRLYSYRKNFQKAQLGEKKGKYVNLDFFHLKALAILDLQLRKQIFGICVDIEHCLKLSLLKDFETRKPEDAYAIVTAFLKSDSYTANDILQKGIQRNGYISDLLKKYISECDCSDNNNDVYCHLYKQNGREKQYCIDMPIWVLLESITFGGLIRFYDFYYKYHEEDSPLSSQLLHSIKSIRNACAHNNCILHDLSGNECYPLSVVRTFVSRKGCTKSMIQSRLRCRTLHEFASVLYLANKRFGDSTFLPKDILQHDLKAIRKILGRFEHKYLSFFGKNDIILSSFQFLKKIVDF